MASTHFPSSCLMMLFAILVLQTVLVTCTQFEVGGEDGWMVPKSKDELVYNEWASKQRFKIGDTLHFTYKKDSVLLVTEAEYEKCESDHPSFFSNNGDTVFQFDRSGLFYFISGVTGHCEKGEKMIIKVLEPAPSPAAIQDSTHQKSAATGTADQNKRDIPWLILSFSTLFFV